MAILWLILVAILDCIALFVGKKYWGKKGIFLFGLINVFCLNIYQISDFPMLMGNLVFGFDAVVYVIFVASVVMLALDDDTKSAKILLYTGVASIVFNALMLLFTRIGADAMGSGWADATLCNLISAIATFVAVYPFIGLVKILKGKKWNAYFIMLLLVVIACVVNNLIYFGFNILFDFIISDFGWAILSSFIGKGITLVFVLVLMWVYSLMFDKKADAVNANTDNAEVANTEVEVQTADAKKDNE